MRTGWLDVRIAIGAALFALVEIAAFAQATTPKPERRPPPPAASTNPIPAGVDSGTPGGSNTLPLGTPVQPANESERAEIRNRSAAARAAARPRAGASASVLSKDCAPAVAASGAPLVVPGSGLPGSSKSPSTGAPLPPAAGSKC